jgi:hypothetical protein
MEDPEAFDSIRQMAIELHAPAFTHRSETPEMMVARLCQFGFKVDGQAGGNYYFSRD